jgi:P4 family phage/plasmid primase-like protien
MDAEAIAHALKGKKNGKGWSCHCPAHDDRNASCSVSEGDDGKVLIRCHTGCAQSAVVDALRLRGLWHTNDESRPNGQYANGKGKYEWFAIPVPQNVKLPDGGQWIDGGVGFPLHYELGAPSSVVWFHDAAGSVVVGECRFDFESGKQYRPLTYRQRDDGRGCQWRWKDCAHPRPLFGLTALLGDPTKPVLVCEGARKAEVARELFPDFVATAPLFGANSPNFTDWSPASGRNVVIWPDNDSTGAKFAGDVADLALEAGAKTVSIVEVPASWPPKWDLRDPLPKGATIETLRELVAAAPAFLPPQTTEVRTNATPLKSLNIGSDVEIAGRVAGDLEKEFGEIVFTDGDFYYFDQTHWITIAKHRLRCLIHIYDGAEFMTPKGEESAVKLSKNRIDSVISEMRAKLTEIDFFAESAVGINCSSGFIAFAADGTPQLQPHNRKHRCRHVLPGTWRPGNGKPPEGSLLQTLLEGVFKDEADAQAKHNLLAETAGSAALGYATRVKAPKALILKGPNAENGKSQILYACRGLLPSSAISSVTAAKMGDERYVIGLAGKLLNASDELSSSAAIASETFKAVVTGEPISGRDVYKSMITFRSVAQHIFACNTLPTFKGGMDRGVIRRLAVLAFNRVIPEEERIENIGLRIADEEPDLLLAWAVAGASKLLENRGFTIPPSSKASLDDWVRDADPVVAWIAARVEPRVLPIPVPPIPPGAYKSGHAYARFKQWALASGYQAEKLPAVNGFSQRLCTHEPKAFIKHTKVGNWLCGIEILENDKKDDEVEEDRVVGVDFNAPPVAGAAPGC